MKKLVWFNEQLVQMPIELPVGITYNETVNDTK